MTMKKSDDVTFDHLVPILWLIFSVDVAIRGLSEI